MRLVAAGRSRWFVPALTSAPQRVSWHESRRPAPLLDAFVEAAAEVCAAIAAGWAAERAA